MDNFEILVEIGKVVYVERNEDYIFEEIWDDGEYYCYLPLIGRIKFE